MNCKEEPNVDDDAGSLTIDAKTRESFRASLAAFALAPSPKKAASFRLLPRNDVVLAIPESRRTLSSRISPSKRKPDSLTVGVPQETGSAKRESLAESSRSSMESGSDEQPRKKKKKRRRGYAAPETYAHLDELQDVLADNLDVIFCGINPGQKSAEIGHHFGHPTNHFWLCLYESGLTSERLLPRQDHTLPERFHLGLTNLVERATAEQSELSLEEQVAGVSALLTKVAKHRPRILCFIGLGIARTFLSRVNLCGNLDGTKVKKPAQKEGLQPYKLVHSSPNYNSDEGTPAIHETLFYALPSTSGRVVIPQRIEKVELFVVLKKFVERLKAGDVDTKGIPVISSQ